MDLEKGARARGKRVGGHGGLCFTAASCLTECLGVSDSLTPYGLEPTRLFCPWNFPSKNTGVDFHALLQGIFQPGIEPTTPALQVDSATEPQGKPYGGQKWKGWQAPSWKIRMALSADRGGRICFALENPRLIKFYEQGRANERHLRRAEDSRCVTPAARGPAMLGAVNLITFHRWGMAAWLGDRAYAASFTFIKRLFSSSSLSAIRVVSSAYLRLLIFLLAILIPACVSSSPAFLMMYFADKLNNHGDSIQPWRTPFPIWNQSVVPCPGLH